MGRVCSGKGLGEMTCHKDNTLVIIPARSGSERIKNKNILDFHGYPLIYWTIDAAINASCSDFILVSTDSDEISEISNNYYFFMVLHKDNFVIFFNFSCS